MIDIDSFPFVASSAPADERQIAILRTLGRLEFAYASWLKALHLSDVAKSTLYWHLGKLHKEGLIWKTPGPALNARSPKKSQAKTDGAAPNGAAPNGKGSVGAPDVYGLTNDGRTLLDTLNAESDQDSLDRLRSRDRKNLQVRTLLLHHDLQVAWWCALMVEAARKSGRLRDIYVQSEYTTQSQRFDAVVILRFNKSHPTEQIARPPYYVPWRTNEPVNPASVDQVAFALEVDRGTEMLKILLEKAVTYRDLTTSGFYMTQLGLPVIPVFLVPTKRRASQIIKEWNHAWPGNPALITTPQGAMHKKWGSLWGSYVRMRDGKSQALLEPVGCPTVEIWEQQWLKPR